MNISDSERLEAALQGVGYSPTEQAEDADFIVLSGDPLSVYTHVLQTYVEGVKVFDRTNPKDYEIAVGGTGVSEQTTHIACFDDIAGGQQ